MNMVLFGFVSAILLHIGIVVASFLLVCIIFMIGREKSIINQFPIILLSLIISCIISIFLIYQLGYDYVLYRFNEISLFQISVIMCLSDFILLLMISLEFDE